MSTTPEYLQKKKAKKFDEWVSRAHRSRLYVMNPSARAKGHSLLKSREETGLLLIAERHKKVVEDTRKRSRQR